MRTVIFLFLCVLSLRPASAQPRTTSLTPLSERLVSYTMNVTLDPDSKTISGTQRLTWKNSGNVPVKELQFHLYLNAFKDNNSTFMRESGGTHRGFVAGDDDPWGGIEITSMRIATDQDDVNPLIPSPGENDLTKSMRFIQPDNSNAQDQTVMAVALPTAVGPGETITLDIVFESRLPEIVARTGWKESESGNPFFMVAQWFPKIAVYELPGQRYVPADAQEGVWNAHQYHQNSEFYADFGTYDVTIEVPEDFIVGATGVRVEESIEGGFKRLRYLADDVHDFAWTASQEYLTIDDQWKHVSIRLLLQPVHEGQAQRHLDATKVALEYYDKWIGEYPYTTLTVVDGLGGSNGMEYPTLITAGTVYGLPEWIRSLELVIIHEFGHQYFYGLMASNEFEEAWLDEGMNSYIETKIMDEEYGSGSVLELFGIKIGDIQGQRLGYTLNRPATGALLTDSWKYRGGDYGKASYSKPATVMNTLERYLGWDRMQDFLRLYYQEWRFRHPSTRDLQRVAEESSQENLEWFFDQFVYGTAVVDNSIESITNRKQEDDTFLSTVTLRRNNDGVFPMTLQIRRADESLERVEWSGEDEWIEMEFQGDTRVVEAYLDPEFNVLLDINRINNRLVISSESDGSFARKAQLRSVALFQKLFYLLHGVL